MKIAIGQYVPGKSLLHRADPRTKFIIVLAYMVGVMMADSFVSYGISALFLVASYICARINMIKILKSIKPLIIMMLLTVILNVLFSFFITINL